MSLAEVTELRDVLSPRVLVALCLLPLTAFALHRLVRVRRKPEDEVVG